jgi:signal transduction histidine kinase
MEWGAIAVLLVAVAAAAIAILGWHRSSRSAQRWKERALAAEAIGREQQLDAIEHRRVRDLTLSTMREGLLLIGADAQVAFANDAIGRHLPATPTTLETVQPFTLRSAIEDSRERGEAASVLVETGVPTRWLRAAITPAADGATLIVVSDVTQQRQLDSVRRDFVANASHELKTPAASIQAAAETLRQVVQDDPDAVSRFAIQLEREAIRLSRIVADLLDLSRLESGSALDDLVSLAAATREEAQRLEEAAGEAGVTLEIEISGERPIRGSQRDLALLVRNLVDNAIRHSHEGSEISVEIACEEDDVILLVSDTGIGIPSKDLPRIFERFYRVDRARSRETGGTGLGLAIVKHVVENHGGTMEVDSELGRGTTFEIRFPAAPVPEGTSDQRM